MLKKLCIMPSLMFKPINSLHKSKQVQTYKPCSRPMWPISPHCAKATFPE